MRKCLLMIIGLFLTLTYISASQGENEKEYEIVLSKEERKRAAAIAKQEAKEAAQAEKQASRKLRAAARKDVTGYWFMHDYHKVRSGIIYVYEYDGGIYGRTLVTVNPANGDTDTYNNPKGRSPYIEGNPFTVGMDVIWVHKWNPRRMKWVNGNILDVRRRKPFNLDMWRDGNELKIFGNIGAGIGATVTWHRATSADLPAGVPVPDVKKFVPKIYY